MASIVGFKITDTLSLIARTCKLTLAPDSSETSPVAEFGLPGDLPRTTGMSIRPNGGFVNILAAYGGIPQHTIFTGSIEYMDDLEDPDKLLFNMDMSDMPAGQRHRKKLTSIASQISNFNGFKVLTSHGVLSQVCALAGINFGRCDLPNFNIVGVYEIVRQTPIQVANDLIGAFNSFDYLKYIVRCDRNGLQIIKIDYTQGGEVTNLHTFTDISSKKRNYEMYMPDNRIGDSDVLLTGGDKYGPLLNGFQQLGSGADGDAYIHPNNPVVKRVSVFKVYTASSQRLTETGQSNMPEGGNSPIMDSWTETETTVDIDLDLTFATGLQYAAWQATWEAETDPNTRDDFNTVLGVFAEGQLLNLTVVDSRVRSTASKRFGNQGASLGIGLIGQDVTTYYYGEETFTRRVWKAGKDTQTMLQRQETLSLSYPNGEEFPLSLVKVYYAYTQYGNLEKTISKTYRSSRVWILETTQIEMADTSTASNAEYQWVAQEAQARTDAGNRALEVLNQELKKALAPVMLGVDITPPEKAGPTRTPIGKYQLLNGSAFGIVPTDPSLRVPMVRVDKSIFPLPDDAAATLWDQNGSSISTEEIARAAFQLGHPYLDYGGLALLWAICQRELVIEKSTSYWEVITVTGSLDTSPTVGESLLADGSSGIVESVEHSVDDDNAVTTVSMRRLILG